MIRNRDILNCLPLLASVLGDRYGVKVEIGGDTAFTNGKTIQIPALPPDCDKTALALAKGYIDHESAHIRFTDLSAFKSVFMLPVTRHLCNSIEDWRVEKRLAELYPGCRNNLAWLIRHIFLEGEQTGEAGNDPASSVLNYVLLTVRSWEVEELKKPLSKIGNVIEKAFPGLREELDKILAKVKSNCPSTQASVGYAIEITDLLRNYEQPSTQKGLEQAENQQGVADSGAINCDEHGQIDKDAECGNEEAEIDESNLEKKGGDETGQIGDKTSLESETGNTGLTSEAEGTEDQGNIEDCSGNQNEETSGNVDKMKSGLQSLLEAAENELPNNLGEILAEKLSEKSGKNETYGIEVAACYDRKTGVLPRDEIEVALRSSNALRQRLAGLLQASELKRIAPSRHGKLNIGKLAGLSAGNPKIFNKEIFAKGQNVAVHILLDASYSMDNEPIKLARQACYAVAKALSTLKGVNPAVTVFPANNLGGVYPILRHGQKFTDRFLVQTSGGTPLAPALWWVLQTIQPLPETRKIVLIITDGVPDNLSAAKDAIKSMQKLGIEIYGIGISLEAIKDMLPATSSVINVISELAPAMFGLLQETLLKGGCHDGAR